MKPAWACPIPWSGVALALILLSGLLSQPGQIRLLVRPILPLLRLWGEPDAQARAVLGDTPYDLLRETDALLPRRARLLLVTPGRDVRHLEYTVFHRALYFLAPRSVWWQAPTPADGTWESRWWISAPLTASAVQTVARAHEVTHILVLQPPGAAALALPGARQLAAWPQGYLLAVEETTPNLPDDRAPVISPPAARPGSLLALPLALAVIWLLGFGVMQGAAWLGYRAAGLELLALAWALGAGVTSLAMWWLDRLGVRLTGQLVVLTLLAVVIALWRLRSPRSPAGRPAGIAAIPGGPIGRAGLPVRLTTGLLAAILIVQGAALTLTACGAPLRMWDSWVTWGMKSRIIFLDGYVSPAVYADPSRAVTLLDYPLLTSLNQAWLYGWLGAADDRLVGVLSVLHYLALLGLCACALRRWGASPLRTLAAVTALALLPNLATWTGAVLSDVPLALYAAIAGLYLAAWLQGEAPGALFVAALAAALLPWTKNEGLLLWLALVAAMLLVDLGARLTRSGARPARPVWLALGALLLLALLSNASWQLFLRAHPVPNAAFVPVTWAAWQANANRLPTIARLVVSALAGARTSLVWPLAAALALARALLPRRPAPAWPTIWLLTPVIYLGLVSLSFVFSDYQPYWQHVNNSIDRLLTHVTPLLLLWLARPTARAQLL